MIKVKRRGGVNSSSLSREVKKIGGKELLCQKIKFKFNSKKKKHL
jgi:hypothetical protein